MKQLIKLYCHLISSSFCVSPPNSSYFWVSLLPKSSSFCMSPFSGTTKARPRKKGNAKWTGFRKHRHPKCAGLRKQGRTRKKGGFWKVGYQKWTRFQIKKTSTFSSSSYIFFFQTFSYQFYVLQMCKKTLEIETHSF